MCGSSCIVARNLDESGVMHFAFLLCSGTTLPGKRGTDAKDLLKRCLGAGLQDVQQLFCLTAIIWQAGVAASS